MGVLFAGVKFIIDPRSLKKTKAGGGGSCNYLAASFLPELLSLVRLQVED